MSKLKNTIRKESFKLSTLSSDRYGSSGIKLNMKSVMDRLKKAGYRAEVEEGSRFTGIKSIKVFADGQGGDGDYGSITIYRNGTAHGSDNWGMKLKSEDEVEASVEQFIKDQKKLPSRSGKVMENKKSVISPKLKKALNEAGSIPSGIISIVREKDEEGALREFQRILKTFDTYYDMSDDDRTYQKGRMEYDSLKQLYKILKVNKDYQKVAKDLLKKKDLTGIS